MPMWRCPHCATPQPEAARCWVCRRSSTSCGTCRSFRRSVAAQIGYCGLDRRRLPLRGDEIRACWEAASPAGQVAASGPGADVEPSPAIRTGVRPREFIPVGRAVQVGAPDAHGSAVGPVLAASEPVLAAAGPDGPAEADRVTLWVDAERF